MSFYQKELGTHIPAALIQKYAPAGPSQANSYQGKQEKTPVPVFLCYLMTFLGSKQTKAKRNLFADD
jgi:hypothetical protein